MFAVGVSGQSSRGPATLPAGVRVVKDIVYTRVGTRDLLLDLYLPEKQEGVLPVVVWVYGGAFRGGSKNDGQTGTATWLVPRGYAVAAFNYRLSQDAKFPAQIEDCKAAVRWVRANATTYQLDPNRIAAWGASAGGHLSAMLGTSSSTKDSSRVQAVVDFYGPTDFLKMDGAAIPGGQKHDPPDSPESQLVGGPIQENKDKVARANPITYVSADAPPFLILHGERDPLVPVNQSELLFEALKAAGANVTFHKIAGAGHGGPQFGTPMICAMVLAFLDLHLKGKQP